jgi:hypothetical protein
MWVKLRTVKQIEVQGKPRTYYPGDWVEVGKHDGLLWIANGDAETVERELSDMMVESGVVIRNAPAPAPLGMSAIVGEPQLPYHLTVIWDSALRLRKELIPTGLHLLGKWEVAVPLWDYDALALTAGDAADRERTVAVIRDLRVPMYDTRLMFVRRCPNGRALIDRFNEERQGGDERLAFLRALYAVKPLICALPTTWRE